jgi:hypothetical protein
LGKIKDGVDDSIDKWVESQGDSKLAMAGGALAKALNEVFMPTELWEIIPIGKGFKLAKKAGQAIGVVKKTEKEVVAVAKAAKKEVEVAKTAATDGTKIKGKVKRKPSRRCELVPYDELLCEAGQEAHHVIPDWMLRMGKRGGPDRIPEMPSLESGPAICLEKGAGKEHNTAHKHTDRPAQRIGKGGGATGVAGTITLGQGKTISSRAIEKATGGKKGGGCTREDIKKQLDEKFKAPEDSKLRGVKDSRKVTDAIRDALNGGKD